MSVTGSGLHVHRLRVEYLVDPIGIDDPRPRLSWKLQSDRRSVVQGTWQVLVAGDRELLERDEGDLWDSGEVTGRESAQIRYRGAPLAARQTAWWKVRVRDGHGDLSAWSDIASWERGLDQPNGCVAMWLSAPHLTPDDDIAETSDLPALVPAVHLRRAFTVSKPIARARLYASARGIYDAFINGQKIGDAIFAPGWTDYNRRIQMQTYDVTAALTVGENVIGAMLGTGWFAGYVGWSKYGRLYGPAPQFLAQLEIDYADGTNEKVATGPGWTTTTDGPVRYGDFLMGEYYDARRDLTGWAERGFDATSWAPAVVADRSSVELVAEPSEPVRELAGLAPIGVTEPSPGTWIFDLGQNIAGRVRLRATGKAGTVVRIRHAEVLEAEGTLYTTNLRGARATDTWVLSGGGEETYEPRFTWHGFRYVEVMGLDGRPDPSMLTGIFIGSDTPDAWTFDSSDDLLNQLERNIDWGQRGNFLSVPTDCPQRDERLGWLGDAQVFVRSAAGNRDVAAFFTKWMRDVTDAQSPSGAFTNVAPRVGHLDEGAPAWADCGVIVPWTIWQAYGDTAIIDEHWAPMTRYLDWLRAANPDLLWKHNRGHDYGDWLSIDADTPKELIGTAFWGYDAKLMAAMAEATGREAEAETFADLHRRIGAAFVDAYVDADGRVEGDTQTAYVLALHFDLLPDELRATAVAHLVAAIVAKDGHLSTGFVGVSYLCHVLSANGHPELAWELLHKRTFPSWNYSILQGATTIWERWDGWTEHAGFQNPGMNSFNHYSLGSVGEWIKRAAIGIDNAPGATGYSRVRIRPFVSATLEYIDGRYESVRGPIRVRWERQADQLELTVELPANVGGELWLPGGTAGAIRERGAPLDNTDGVGSVRVENGHVVVEVGSGNYLFTVPAV